MKKDIGRIKLRRFKALVDSFLGVSALLFSSIYFPKVYNRRLDLMFASHQEVTHLSAKEIFIANFQNIVGVALISIGWVFVYKGMQQYKKVLSDLDEENKE